MLKRNPSRIPARIPSWVPPWILPWIPWQFIRFGMVGTIGFLIDAGLLRALLFAGFGFYGGRAVSFLVAVTAMWLLNRSFTFRNHIPRSTLWRQWLSYFGFMVLGGAVNYGAYALAIENSALIRHHPELGVALGALAGMAINYWSAKTMVFPERSPQDE